jgi:hypothetical protein
MLQIEEQELKLLRESFADWKGQISVISICSFGKSQFHDTRFRG